MSEPPFTCVTVPERSSSEDAALLARLATIVNDAYRVGEAGMWLPGVERVGRAGLQDDLRAGRLLVAVREGEVVGVVRVAPVDATAWGLGMLAVDPDVQGAGLGALLVDAAEDAARAAGAAEMQLELLVPRSGEQPSKTRLAAWYGRRGYVRVGEGAIEDDHPELVALLAVPCAYEVWRRPLR